MQKRRLLLAMLLCAFWLTGFAQKTVTGTVKDATGEPMIGVSVIIDGTSIGGVTDFNGDFTIQNVPDNAVLKFSYVGYKDQKVPTAGKTSFNVTLQEDAMGLDEVVVVGYGTMKKRDLTGAVASIKQEDLKNVASANAMQAMQAKIPGLDLQQSSGEAGAGVKINLRGARSMLASNDPLILVDGVAYGSTLDLNPSDIESMEVLKDAASTAIYGTRGANGVIIITTKRGKAGKTHVNFNFYNSWNSPTKSAEPMYGDKEVQRLIDKAEYAANYATWKSTGVWGTATKTAEDVLTLKLADNTSVLDIYNDKSYTNWSDYILQNSASQNYEVSVSGGGDKTNFNVSLGLMNANGLMKNDEFHRYNGKINLDHKINDMFKVGASILYTYRNNDRRNSGVYTQSLKMTTITHAYLNDGSINMKPNPWYDAHVTPLADDVEGAYKNNTEGTRFFGNAYVEVTPLKGLMFRSQFALDSRNSREGLYQDYQSQQRFQSPTTSYVRQTKTNINAYTWDNTLNYMKTIGQHDFTILLGHEMTQSVTESSIVGGDAGAVHLTKAQFYDLSKVSSLVGTNTYVKTAMLSFFGRLNYSFMDRYLLQASLRADGSSTLAKGHKWGYFPSVSAGWRITEEKFMEGSKSWLSNLKLRASWGLSGNAAIDAYSTLASLSDLNYYYFIGNKDVSGKVPSNMANENLTWEKTSSFDLGLDFGFLDGRIQGGIDIYWNKTYDLLFYKTGPASSAFPTVIDNIGKTKGFGIEASLQANIIRTKDFDWTSNFTYTHFKDEITELTGGVNKYVSGTTGLFVGERVNAYYDYQPIGIWGIDEYNKTREEWNATHDADHQMAEWDSKNDGYGTPGSPKYLDVNQDGKITDEDRVIYNQDPDHVIGWTNTFSYKGFSLSVQMMARLGGYIAYGMNEQLNYESANWGDIDYWTPNNPNAKFPSPGLTSNGAKNWSVYRSSFLYEKGDYFKVKDITLAYQFDKSLLKHVYLNSARVYCSLKNFITSSKIDNYDPERGGSISFPMQKQVVLGVNVEF